MTLSNRQREILCAIARFYAVNGYAISNKDLAEAVGLSVGAHLYFYLDELKDSGYLSWSHYENRTLHLTPKGRLASLEVAIA